MANLEAIEGIGETYAEKLKSAGVHSVEALLEKGAQPKDRQALSAETGAGDKLILKWVNRADLARIKGIGGEYADLLECSGVDTVPELAQRNAENLFTKMTEVNAEKNLCRKLPSADTVTGWIAQAKELPRAIHY